MTIPEDVLHDWREYTIWKNLPAVELQNFREAQWRITLNHATMDKEESEIRRVLLQLEFEELSQKISVILQKAIYVETCLASFKPH
jgi:hypothetical protein